MCAQRDVSVLGRRVHGRESLFSDAARPYFVSPFLSHWGGGVGLSQDPLLLGWDDMDFTLPLQPLARRLEIS